MILLEQDRPNVTVNMNLHLGSILVKRPLSKGHLDDLKQLRLHPRSCVPEQVLLLEKNLNQEVQVLLGVVCPEMIT